MALTPEGRVTKQIKEFLTKIKKSGAPIFFAKIAGGPRQRVGLPDWHITYRGQSIWIEVKAPGFEEPEDQTIQGRMIEEIRKAGGVSRYVTSVDEVEQVLRDVDMLSIQP